MKPDKEETPQHEGYECDFCEEEAVQWVVVEPTDSDKESRTLYMCDDHTLDSEEWEGYVGLYACELGDDCDICKHN